MRGGEGDDLGQGGARPDQRPLRADPPRRRGGGRDLEAAIKANARIQADLLRTASPVVADLTAKGQLKVVAGYYDIGSGAVDLLA